MKDTGHTLLYLPPYPPDLNPIETQWSHATHCSIDALFFITIL
ncbi:transposase [Holospora curviuscula]